MQFPAAWGDLDLTGAELIGRKVRTPDLALRHACSWISPASSESGAVVAVEVSSRRARCWAGRNEGTGKDVGAEPAPLGHAGVVVVVVLVALQRGRDRLEVVL